MRLSPIVTVLRKYTVAILFLFLVFSCRTAQTGAEGSDNTPLDIEEEIAFLEGESGEEGGYDQAFLDESLVRLAGDKVRAWDEVKDLCLLLLEKGADPNAENGGGESALLLAAGTGKAEMAGLLLNYGAALEEASPSGETALSRALSNSQDEVFRLLLSLGADSALLSEAQSDPLKLAFLQLEAESCRLLIEKGQAFPSSETADELLPEILSLGEKKKARLLLDQGADPNGSLEGGYPALWYALMLKDEDFLETFLGRGADLSIQDDQGRNVLLFLAKLDNFSQREQVEYSLILLNWGADYEARNNQGASFFSLCAGFSSPLLLEWGLNLGLDINTPDEAGLVPLHFASWEFYDILISKGAAVIAFPRLGSIIESMKELSSSSSEASPSDVIEYQKIVALGRRLQSPLLKEAAGLYGKLPELAKGIYEPFISRINKFFWYAMRLYCLEEYSRSEIYYQEALLGYDILYEMAVYSSTDLKNEDNQAVFNGLLSLSTEYLALSSEAPEAVESEENRRETARLRSSL